MGRMPKPTEILDAKGTFLRHPEFRRPKEPTVTKPLGNPPTHLTPEQKKAWKELAKQMPPGVAKQSDRIAFEMMAVLLCKFRAGTAKVAESAQLVNLCARCGMTPSDRTRIQVDSEPTDDLDTMLADNPSGKAIQ